MILVTGALFFAGLLAGAEVVVRFGVRGPLAALPDEAHIRMRQGLIRTLRVLVPALFVPTLVLSVAALIAGPTIAGGVAVAALLGWAATTFLGTVPINSAAIDWLPAAPPAHWREVIARWERLDSVRCAAAVIAFIALLG
jgi:hypothetical protein